MPETAAVSTEVRRIVSDCLLVVPTKQIVPILARCFEIASSRLLLAMTELIVIASAAAISPDRETRNPVSGSYH
jgi:hypothetical protein